MLGVAPSGYEAALKAERDELNRERVRLWYVAATRARELLILPRLDVAHSNAAWVSLVDLLLPELPAFDASQMSAETIVATAGTANEQTREVFAAEAAGILDRQTSLTWLAPSRDENATGAVLQAAEPDIWSEAEDGPPTGLDAPGPVQGGRDRGLVLHKLMEEVLIGEVDEARRALEARAAELIRALGKAPVDDLAAGLSPKELAGCVTRTLALHDVAALRPALLAEYPVYALREEDAGLVATAGIADALTIGSDGRPVVVIDWKSDVNPDAQTVEHYRQQVRAYLAMTGAERGLTS